MTTTRQVEVMAASAILRGLGLNIIDTVLRRKLVDLSVRVEASAISELESEVAADREQIRILQSVMSERGTLAGIIMSEALSGVNLLLMP